MNENGHMTNGTILKGAAGTGAALGASILSFMPALEMGLRVAGLCVGLAIGLITLHGLVKKLRNKS